MAMLTAQPLMKVEVEGFWFVEVEGFGFVVVESFDSVKDFFLLF